MKKQYHIVWNAQKTEGYITDNEDDATYASSGMVCGVGASTIAEAMREAYAQDEDSFDDTEEELPTQTVTIEV